jgi:hypothetical protein
MAMMLSSSAKAIGQEEAALVAAVVRRSNTLNSMHGM